jgi:hypothetical protein
MKRAANKRGLSDIVVSVLLILLVLSAIVIIWTFVRPVVLGASKDVRTDDFTTKLDIYPKSDLNGDIQFSVKRGAGKGDLAGFYVSYQDSTGKAVTDNVNYSTTALGELEAKSIGFNYTDAGLVDVVKISIVPLFHLQDNTIQTGKNVVVKQIGGYVNDVASSSGNSNFPNCGNGNIDSGEECDSSNLNSQSCFGLGYAGGVLSCSSSCTLDESRCVSKDQLLGYWKFEGDFLDSSGKGNDGNSQGATIVNGKVGGAARFEGGYIEIPSIITSADSEFTYLMWIDSSSSSPSWLLYQGGGESGLVLGQEGNPDYVSVQGIIGGDWKIASSNLDSQDWNFLAGSFKKEDSLKIYVNGQFKSTQPVSGSLKSWNGNALGAYGYEPTLYPFYGSMDEVMIFSRTLSDQEIKNIYDGSN